jgi:type VI protein secretion system component VasF
VQAEGQQSEKQASDCRFTPDPNNQAAVDDFWRKYYALNDVATGLFMRAEILRMQDRCQEARAIYNKVIDEYPCAFAWDPRGGFFWNVADGAQNGLNKPCP